MVAALALFGLLAMHGWGTHAGMHVGMNHGSIPDAPHSAEDHAAGTEKVPAGLSMRAAALNRAADCGSACGGSGSARIGLIALCLAVLGALGLAVVLLLLRRRIPKPRSMLPTRRRPVIVSRDRDPPDLLRLCVIRC